jgi:branched-chain amino acid transport system permease protein
VLLDRVRGQALPETLLTIALSIIIADVSLAIWGGFAQSIRVPAALNPRISLFGFVYPGFRFLILGLASSSGWVCGSCSARPRSARPSAPASTIARPSAPSASTSTASSPRVRALGVPGRHRRRDRRVLPVHPAGRDMQILILSLVVVILGGLGSLGGAVIAALVTGLLLSFSRAYFPELSFFMVFGPMALVLAFRPQGLFGKWT